MVCTFLSQQPRLYHVGPLARIGPNHLLLSDPDAIRKMLAARSLYTRGPWYDSLRIDPHRANLITERDEKKHRVLRQQMAAGYAGNDVDELESTINERIAEWISYIRCNAASDASKTVRFDMARSMQYLTTDVISHLCFGEPFGFVKTHGDVYGFIATLESRLPFIENFSVIVELNRVLSAICSVPFLKNRLLPQPTDEDGLGKIVGISRKVVDKRFEPNAVPQNDILGSFLKNKIPREQAESEITISLFAGSDTTATSLRGTILHIATNPQVYSRLVNEISAASIAGKISNPMANEEAANLPFLQACIKEGLRIFPPITSLRERAVPAGGDTILGHFVPAGTNIGINMAGTMLNEVFGHDADVFRPDRWFEKDPAKLNRMERVHELVFGHGGTSCLGIRIANMTLNKTIVEPLSWYILSARFLVENYIKG
ncbi:Cytochrome P450 monooxygenase gsfF [Lachnellula cervina]|uniref:Cytochrome P450 monooxygenase gsfF n=1 Tax=Lachnellula cervina TaxID=1316786 RepID=A0A7D8UML4_9HELO|nr:Cytochrome P450 monooxygenase gsfF [Lachnellula cervina]